MIPHSRPPLISHSHSPEWECGQMLYAPNQESGNEKSTRSDILPSFLTRSGIHSLFFVLLDIN